ncbi:MAG: hypothetical protein WC998_00460 [Candidatus Paceibacterota bacterium]|jgi:hypothetical protein
MRIVTACTPAYRNSADKLYKSAEKLELPMTIVPYKDRGSWLANCNYKPTAILQVMEEFKDSMLWLDADSEIIAKPVINPTWEIAYQVSKVPSKFIYDFTLSKVVDNINKIGTPQGCVMYFKYSSLTLELLKGWKNLCDAYQIRTNDEQCLRETLKVFGKLINETKIGKLNCFFLKHKFEGKLHGKIIRGGV